MNERGSILPLVAGLLALTGVFTIGVIDSTDLAIRRTELQSLADGAALAAAQSVSPSAANLLGDSLVVTLNPTGVRRDARAFISDSGVPGIRVRSVSVPDSRTAIVTLSRVWRAPLDNDLLPLRIRLTATGRARTVFG